MILHEESPVKSLVGQLQKSDFDRAARADLIVVKPHPIERADEILLARPL
jgi:hypothetical protein